MSDKEILEKAIRKAVDGGLTGYWRIRYRRCVELGELEYLFHENDESDYRFLIFSHDFAKALWPLTPGVNYDMYKPAWEIHLQQMVIADNPIKYLGENI